MCKNTPSSVGNTSPNMKYVDWPEHIVCQVDMIVDAWFENDVWRDNIDHALTDEIYDTYFTGPSCPARFRRLNVNEMRFFKQAWANAVNRNLAKSK